MKKKWHIRDSPHKKETLMSLSIGEYLLLGAINLLAMIIISILFYDWWPAFLFLMPIAYVMFRMEREEILRRRKKQILLEFKEWILCLMTAMHSGMAFERALSSAKRDLEIQYQGKYHLSPVLSMMEAGIQNNVPANQLLEYAAKETESEDFVHFAEVIGIAKRDGGNMVHIMEKTVRNIANRIDTEEEIQTIVTAKKLEQAIMSMMPFAILLYMRVCNGNYMDVLYHNVFGVVAMSVCLVLTFVCVYWGRRIVHITV